MKYDKARKVAEEILGLHEDEARALIDKNRVAYRFVVMEGRKCGVNTDVSAGELCLFTNEDNIVFKTVVGSHGIYNNPAYLDAKEREA